MKVRKIFTDMDGVLADFDGGVRDLLSLPPFKQEKKTDAQDDEMYSRMRGVPHFYEKLAVLPGAKEMFVFLTERFPGRCEILSGIPRPSRGITTAGEDKINWMKKNFSGDIPVHIVLRAEKPLYCTGEDCVLIDDFEKNIREWRENGGTGILCRDPLSVMDEIKRMGLE